jgi:hypothetical protein
MHETDHCGAELALHRPFLAPDDKRTDIILACDFIPRLQCVRHRNRVQVAKTVPSETFSSFI